VSSKPKKFKMNMRRNQKNINFAVRLRQPTLSSKSLKLKGGE
jgi:hypothetical protein